MIKATSLVKQRRIKLKELGIFDSHEKHVQEIMSRVANSISEQSYFEVVELLQKRDIEVFQFGFADGGYKNERQF